MGVIARWLGTERRNLSLGDMDRWMDAQLTGPMSAAGIAINPDMALQSAVVYACVNVIAQDIASMPLLVYRRLPNGGKERAPEHRLYTILHDQPNPEMTAYEFRACLIGHVLLWGNAYAEIERSDAGINALWPLRPDRMTLMRDDAGNLVYHYRLIKPDPRTNLPYKDFRFEQIMHWRGLSGDGLRGYSPITAAAEAVGVDMATRQYGASFFGNGSRPGGVLVHPKSLSPDAAKKLKASWEDSFRGLSNAQRIAVLEEGISYQQIGIPPEDAQFLETRKYTRTELCGIYRVAPHKIGDLERATFSNIEHQDIDHVKSCLRPWLVQIEQAIRRDLFSISDGKRTHFAEHLVDGLLRGDIQSRYQAYNIAHMGGWMSADEIRAYENMNKMPDDQGAVYWMPANMMTIEKALEPPEPVPAALAAFVKPEPEEDEDEDEEAVPEEDGEEGD